MASDGRLTRFVAPRPRRWMMRATAPLNRIVMLEGIAGMRDTPGLRRIPGLRGLADIREFDLPSADEARLRDVCGPGRATFLAPNHPEFFTDWMIDKEIVSRVAPMTASWATNTIVNGMGALMQRFCLANNLIAQIPGNAEAARAHSVDWAVKGNCVLLHPEGAVGWHGDWVAPLLPGAAEMAMAARRHGGGSGPGIAAWVVPIVWKLVFLNDVDAGLKAECRYVEGRLGVATPSAATPVALRIYAIYEAMLARDEAALGIVPDRASHLVPRWEAAISAAVQALRSHMGVRSTAPNPAEAAREGRRWLRDRAAAAAPDDSKRVRAGLDRLQRLMRLGPFAWRETTMTQEHAAEHLKRLRSDYCSGTMTDTLGKLVPRPVGPRRVLVRVPEPIDAGRFGDDAAALTDELRHRLQVELEIVNGTLRDQGAFSFYENPFHP